MNEQIAQYGWQANFGSSMYTYGYIDSFKTAADCLVEKQMPDLLLFPIMFNYRQYIELLLKNICYRHLSESAYITFIRKVSHNLVDVWTEAKKYLTSKTEIELKTLECVVTFFAENDPNSFAFRFEFDKKMKRNLEKPFQINLFELKCKIDQIDGILYDTYNY